VVPLSTNSEWKHARDEHLGASKPISRRVMGLNNKRRITAFAAGGGYCDHEPPRLKRGR